MKQFLAALEQRTIKAKLLLSLLFLLVITLGIGIESLKSQHTLSSNIQETTIST